MIEKYGWIGKVNIIKKKNGIITRDYIIYNRIMNAAFDEIIKALYLPNPDMVMKYLAFGDDDTAVTNTDLTLGNELYRVPIISLLRTGTGKVQSRGVLLDTEPTATVGVMTIKEIGWFVGTTADAWNGGVGKDTGLLLSRIVLTTPEAKTDDEQIDVTRTDEFIRG
jgi:hypothetical protein